MAIGSRGQPQVVLIKGRVGAGAIPLSGVLVGDRVVDMHNVASTNSDARSHGTPTTSGDSFP
jgi:hypothetical protein